MSRAHHADGMRQFVLTIREIQSLKDHGDWAKVSAIVGKCLKRLLGANYHEFVKLTELDMLARVIARGGSTIWVPTKLGMLITILKEAGDFAKTRYPPAGGYGWYLKALHLRLELPEECNLGDISPLVPSIGLLLESMRDSPLPVGTRLLLMREYERGEHFARALCEFRAALKKAPDSPRLMELGIALFERLSHQSDETLGTEKLSRSDIQAELFAMRLRRQNLCPGSN